MPACKYVCKGAGVSPYRQSADLGLELLTSVLWLLQQAEAATGAQQNEAFEIDQWILDFANLFREQLNIEPDKHLDLTNMGWDKLQAALDSAVQSDQAPAIFDAAADKFQEVSAHGAPAPDPLPAAALHLHSAAGAHGSPGTSCMGTVRLHVAVSAGADRTSAIFTQAIHLGDGWGEATSRVCQGGQTGWALLGVKAESESEGFMVDEHGSTSLSGAGGAAGMLQWGNVFFCVAKRTVDKAALAGQDITEEVVAAAEKDLRQAEAKYEESRRIKPNYYDAFISMGNVDFERAKLRLGFAVPPPTYASQHLKAPMNLRPNIAGANAPMCRGPQVVGIVSTIELLSMSEL